MIVDTSAIVAIFRNEPDAEVLVRTLKNSNRAYLVAPNYLKLCMVLVGEKTPQAMQKIKLMLDELGVILLSFTPEMAEIAALAFQKYGKGRNSKASLNFGDCMAYAASKVEGLPLLFKGEDFRHTDVDCAT